MRNPPDQWPGTPKNIPTHDDDVEKKKFHVQNAKALTLKMTQGKPILDPTKFSSWSSLVMATAHVLSLKDLSKRHWLKELTVKIAQWPSRKRIKEAEIYWIRQAQKDIDFENGYIMKLNPFMDEEEHVFRVGGRIHHAPLSYDMRHPYLLPRKNHISILIAREKLRHALHGGHLRTSAEIRKTYWIIGDANLSKRIVRECIICRRHRGKPLQ